MFVLWQNAHLLHSLVAKDDRQAVDAGAGHAGGEPLVEDAQPLVGPQHAYRVGNGAPVDLHSRKYMGTVEYKKTTTLLKVTVAATGTDLNSI